MDKLAKLRSVLKRLKRVVLAYSGGLDSTFLLKIAVDTLGEDNALAVTARSETYPESEYRDAKRLAAVIGARHIAIYTDEFNMREFRSNPVNRCYYCKKELFRKLGSIRKRFGMKHVIDGTNLDDLDDVRYGRKAARELGVRSPLLEAKITKSDIRRFSKSLKLPSWDKPSFACLASRIPFNDKITVTRLAKVEKAEEYLRGIGFGQVRVRLHKDIARIELLGDDLQRALNRRAAITRRLKDIGFTYVTLDLAGYRTGSLHEAA